MEFLVVLSSAAGGSGDCSSIVVKVLCHKLEGRWFNSRRYHWNFLLT